MIIDLFDLFNSFIIIIVIDFELQEYFTKQLQVKIIFEMHNNVAKTEGIDTFTQ